MRKLIFALVLIGSLPQSVNAGVWATTAHSRANCFGFNESVTWNAHAMNWWRVDSVHFHKDGSSHKVGTGMNYTWRAAAYHTGEWEGEYGNNWHVQGYHFYRDNNGREIYDAFTDAFVQSV